MRTKKTAPTLSDYKTLVEKLCTAKERSEFEDIYNGFFNTKEPIFPKYLIKTPEDKKLVKGWIDTVDKRINKLKGSEEGDDAAHFFTIISGDLFLGIE